MLAPGRRYVVRCATFCAATLLLAACGGGVDNNGNSAGGSSSGAGSGSTPSNAVVTTVVGQATIQKTFRPNVVIFPDAAPITELSPGTFQIAGAPQGFGSNSVFTWMDRPYVVTSLTAGGNGTVTVSTRDAQIDEVLAQLTVTGDLTIDDADLTRLVVADSNNNNATPVITNDQASTAAVMRSTKVALGPCKGVKDDATQKGSTTISCSIVNVPVGSGLFVINGTAGIKDIKFSGLNINLATQSFTLGNVQATPYFALSGQVSTATDRPGEVKGDVPVFKVRLPIAATLDFVNIDVPIYLSYDIPVYNVGVGVSGEFPYASGAFQPTDIVIQTPTATLSTEQGFTSAINDAFLGLKTGVQLVVSKFPSPLSALLSLASGWPKTDDRALAAGIFGTLGEYGSLSIALTPPATSPCFNWNLATKANALAEVTLLNDPIASLDTTALELFPALAATGQSGCSDNSALSVTSNAMCFPSSRTDRQPINTNNDYYWQVNANGTASGPVGTFFEVVPPIVSGNVEATDVAFDTTCGAWHTGPGRYPNVPTAITCMREQGDPASMTWTTTENFILDQAAPLLYLDFEEFPNGSGFGQGARSVAQCPVHP